MSKKTDIEIRNFHLEKAKQAENRIKQKEKRMKEQQRKKENSIKFTMGGMMFKFLGEDVSNLTRKELEAHVNGLASLFEHNRVIIKQFKQYGKSSLEKYHAQVAEVEGKKENLPYEKSVGENQTNRKEYFEDTTIEYIGES